jgi:dihydrofolate reductase
VRFPAIDPDKWRVTAVEEIPAGEKDSAATTFVVYDRAAAGKDSG